MAKVMRQVVLQHTTDGHYKYYEMSVVKTDDYNPKYIVVCKWGRIEHFKDGNPQHQEKGTYNLWENAEAQLGKVMYSKLKKGYKVFIDKGKGSLGTPDKEEYTSKSQEKRVKIQKGDSKPFERTEHQEVGISDWWKNAEVNIEERVI